MCIQGLPLPDFYKMWHDGSVCPIEKKESRSKYKSLGDSTFWGVDTEGMTHQRTPLNSDIKPAELRKTLGEGHSDRINTMVMSIIKASSDRPIITMEDNIQAAANELREFLFEHVYRNPIAKSEESKAQDMLMFLFEYYVKNPDKLPALYQKRREIDSIERCVCDFISGMTDRYATETFTDICVPKVWRGRQ